MVARLRHTLPTPAVAVAPFGLINTRTLVEDASKDEHWAGGFQTDSEVGTSGLVIRDSQAPCDVSSDRQIVLADPIKSIDRILPYNPFIVQAVDIQSVFGCTAEERRNRVLRQLKANISYAAEVEFWYGELARLQAANGDTVNKYLTTDQALVAPPPSHPWGTSVLYDVTPASAAGTGVDPVLGLGLVEDAANSVFHDAAFVHVPRFLLAKLAPAFIFPEVDHTNSPRLTEPIPDPGQPSDDDRNPEYIPGPVQQSDIIRTLAGNFVIAGHGYSKNYYPGFSPTGPTMGPWNGTDHNPGVWMYATGPVAVRIGKPVVIPELNSQMYSERNELALRAEAPVAVTWDGPHVFAVRVKEN